MLEFVDALEYNGQQYQAFFPAETEGEDEDPDNGLVILKVLHEDGEDLLSTLDSDEELDAVYDLFMEDVYKRQGQGAAIGLGDVRYLEEGGIQLVALSLIHIFAGRDGLGL